MTSESQSEVRAVKRVLLTSYIALSSALRWAALPIRLYRHSSRGADGAGERSCRSVEALRVVAASTGLGSEQAQCNCCEAGRIVWLASILQIRWVAAAASDTYELLRSRRGEDGGAEPANGVAR